MKYSILLLWFFIPFILSAQKNFQPGYLVNLKGDTSLGFIDYKEWDNSPTRILFKLPGANVDTKEYTVSDISFFKITDKEAYRRSVVKISLHPAKVNDLQGRDTSWKIDTVFLKVIQAGKLVSLFSYTDKIKERFYILEEEQHQPTELIIMEYIKEGSMSLVTENLYKGQLQALMFNKNLTTDKLSQRIEEAVYDERDLKEIILLMNRTNNGEQTKERKSSRTYWFAGAGLQQDKLLFDGDIPFATSAVSNTSNWLPKISAGFDLFANPNVGKIFYRIELGYQMNKATSIAQLNSDVKAVYKISGSTISLQPQLNYAIYNSANLKIPLGLGLAYNRMIYSRNQYKKVYANGDEGNVVEDWLDLKKSNTTFFGRVAAELNNKIEAAFLYRIPTNLVGNAVYSIGTSSMQLQVYFLFRKNK
jgi:hypothetical protein